MSDGTSPIRVSVTVENTGACRAAKVPQVHPGFPASTGEPPKCLVSFEKVWLQPGQSKPVEIVIDPRASNHPSSTWDPNSQRSVTAEGIYQLYVGTSSASLPLRDTVTVRVPRGVADTPLRAASLDHEHAMRLENSPQAIEEDLFGAEWRLMLHSQRATREPHSIGDAP